MSYRTLLKKENEQIRERYDLAVERISAIAHEQAAAMPWADYFVKTAQFIQMMDDLSLRLERDELIDADVKLLQDINRKIYQDILPASYDHSYANPKYAQAVFGQDYGCLLSALYAEIRGMIVYAWQCRRVEMTLYMELFLEVYQHFIWGQPPKPKQIRQAMYWFYSDYSDVLLTYRLREQLDVSLNFYTDIVMHSDLMDERYLYRYGAYISDAECQRARRMRDGSEIEIRKTAEKIVDDYLAGVQTVQDIDQQTVSVSYAIGQERLARAVIECLISAGMAPLICDPPVQMILHKDRHSGICCAGANPQYARDHQSDMLLLADKALVERMLSALRSACTQMKTLIDRYAGTICLHAMDSAWTEDRDGAAADAADSRAVCLMKDYTERSAEILQKYTDAVLMI